MLIKNEEIQTYSIYDSKLIESKLISIGMDSLLQRYFPESFKAIKPLHLIVDEYIPLKCDHCGRDLLEALYDTQFIGGLYVEVFGFPYNDKKEIVDIYLACKDRSCDKSLERKYTSNHDKMTAWHDISDLAMPNDYVRFICASLNEIHSDRVKYNDLAFKKLKTIIIAMAQKNCRYVTDDEKSRFKSLIKFSI